MKTQFLSLFALLLLPATAVAQLLSVKTLGPLTVGDRVPSVSGFSQKGTAIGSGTPHGKFYAYFINDTLPPTCFDEECGETGKRIAELGGHLIGSSDGKLASQFGVKLVSSKPWKFDRSLFVLTSETGAIIGIYDKATMGDINKEVERFLKK
jgi:hypothetical protein